MKKALLKDSAVYLSGSIIVQALSFIGLILLMQHLPVAEYGKYTYVIEFIAIFAFFSDGGLTQYIIKETAQNPGAVRDVYLKAQSAQLPISLGMLALIAVITFPTNSLHDFYLLGIYGLSVVISGYFAPVVAVLIASGRKDLIFYKDVSLSILKLAFMVAGIIMNTGIDYFIWLGFVNCGVLLMLALYSRHIQTFDFFTLVSRGGFKGDFTFLRQGILFTMLMAVNVIYNKIDVIMLEKMAGSTEVGYYSGATRFVYPFMFISSAFMTAIFPRLARYSNDERVFWGIQRLAMYYLTGIGIVLSLVIFLSSYFLFDIFFGDKYDESIPVLRILAWYLAIVFTYGPISNSLVAKNKIRFLVWLNLVMIILNVALNCFLIPVYGAVGAAAATIVCEILILVAAFGSLTFIREAGHPGSPDLRDL